MSDEGIGRAVASWSAHHIPPGSVVRYTLDPADETPIRLIIGDLEQLELGMATSKAVSIAAFLQDAERNVRSLQVSEPKEPEFGRSGNSATR